MSISPVSQLSQELEEINPLIWVSPCAHDLPLNHLIVFSILFNPLETETEKQIFAKMNNGRDKYFLVKCPKCNKILELGKRGERARE